MTENFDKSVETKHKDNPDVRPQQVLLDDNYSTPAFPRDFKSCFNKDFLKNYHKGVMNYKYKDIPCLKSPIDLALYMMLIHKVKPKTIVEIGSFQGGSALFYADLADMYGISSRVITVDFRDVQSQSDSRVEFIRADALNLEDSELHEALKSCPKPWLIIEDSAHTFDVCYAVLEYFSDKLDKGEYLIMEDGIIEDQGGNHRYGGGPNKAIHEFFKAHPDVYHIDESLTDFFGYNATFNPNGYLVKN
ncbi:CmcI family methyltransferase [Shewanella waksmanii]|uniref:CmcI family methyltransferase n=1 Tax=Shewanella waksmanii TaxID=213783 RepID=UPI0004AEA1DE|nr:CmcI family methyltransferase [Shewanella waksmanii]